MVGLQDTRLQEKLQLMPDLTLNKALEISRQHEQVKNQMKGDKSEQSTDEATWARQFQQYAGRSRNQVRGRSSGHRFSKDRKKSKKI